MKSNDHPAIVILTGAGISAESGIKTFRDHNGLWENHRIEDVASPEGFKQNPDFVHRFYNTRRAQLLSPEVQPNAAHKAIAELERRWGADFLLVTQNVDDLHERAGSKNLIHMHGELLKVRCNFCKKIVEWKIELMSTTSCPHCKQTASLRPNIVWFGEMPLEMTRITQALERCSLFIAIGTSAQVYPAAGFVDSVPPNTRKVEINMERSMMSHMFDEHIQGKAGDEVPKFIETLLR